MKDLIKKLYKRRKEILTVLVTVAVIISITFSYNYFREDEDDDIDGIDRSVEFPEDEGYHDEFFETWELSLSLSSGGDDFKVFVRCRESRAKEGVMLEYEIVDVDNTSGEKYHFHTTESGSLVAEEHGMDMRFWDDKTNTTIKSSGDFKYQLKFDMLSGISLDLELNDEEEPILFGEEGKIYNPAMGTIFGYYQPKLQVAGTIQLPGGIEKNVAGNGWFEHTWGGNIKSLTYEGWKIKLDNSVNIYIKKYYDPQKDYPDNLFLSIVNIVDKDGELQDQDIQEDIKLRYNDYKMIPADDTRTQCWSYSWNLENDIFNLTINPNTKNVLHTANWLGFCTVEGTYDDENVDGYAFSDLNHRYTSSPMITDVTDDFSQEIPTEPVQVSANISYVPPISIEEIYLEYRVNQGVWNRIDMSESQGTWTAEIPGQELGVEVEYKVIVRDQADKVIESDIFSYESSVD